MRLVLALCATLALAACDTASDSPRVPGTYEAIRYITPAPYDGPVDQLALGGSLVLRLNEDGTYEGQERRAEILVGPGEDGVAFQDLELAGTYRVQADTLVQFTRSQDENLLTWHLHYDARTGVLSDSMMGIGPYVLVLAPRLAAALARRGEAVRPASSARPR